jgi:KaiC/GvpD/RAD55 family RecA-like ATPase
MTDGTVARGERLAKAPTGIRGFDEITGGGLPQGRPTLVCGGPGCGKTLFGMEFLIHGAVDHGEPGVFVSFEETAVDLAKNVASLGHDLGALIEERKIAVDHVKVERSEIEETGEYDLEGLFVRLGFAIDSIKARRVVLDTVEALFAALPNEGILRAELRRLFQWLRDKGVTAIITGERGEGALTRRGLEEYVSDCVILLDQRVQEQMATRRLRVVKYRGTAHGTNEYPFLIHARGFSVLPTTSLGLSHEAPTERVPTGVAGLAPCSAARASTAAAACSSRGPRAPASPASPRTSPRPPASAASAASTSPSRSRRARSSATCAPSAWISRRSCTRACSSSTPRAPRSSAWRCTSPACTSAWSSRTRTS